MSAARVPRASGEGRYRLRGPQAFETLFKTGDRREGPYLQIVSTQVAGRTGRIGFVIGAKALPRAVDRNAIRRQLREAVRRARPALLGYDVILRLKRACPRGAARRIGAEADALLAGLVGSAP